LSQFFTQCKEGRKNVKSNAKSVCVLWQWKYAVTLEEWNFKKAVDTRWEDIYMFYSCAVFIGFSLWNAGEWQSRVVTWIWASVKIQSLPIFDLKSKISNSIFSWNRLHFLVALLQKHPSNYNSTSVLELKIRHRQLIVTYISRRQHLGPQLQNRRCITLNNIFKTCTTTRNLQNKVKHGIINLP
jgi:hypothetical protein